MENKIDALSLQILEGVEAGASYGTVTPRWDKEVCYRIPFKEQAPQIYPLLGTML